MKAKWNNEYDYRSDKAYYCPACPECDVPLYAIKDEFSKESGGVAICSCCDKEVELDSGQLSWMVEHLGTKVEKEKCFDCGSENCLEVVYTKNPVSLKWEVLSGKCSKCGLRFIV